MRAALRLTAVLVAIGFGPAAQAVALERLPRPQPGASHVSRVADLETRPFARTHRNRDANPYWQWRYRAAYTRWLHNEYVHSGYPVEHRQYKTYARAVPCCYYRRW